MKFDIEKLKNELKKDFHQLYQKNYSTLWQEARLIRDSEIEIMNFENTVKFIEKLKRE